MLLKNTFSTLLLLSLSILVTSTLNAQTTTTCVQTGSNCEDAEESDNGDVDLTSSDLDLGKHLSGLTFANLGIPLNAFITNATITFTSKGTSSDATTQLLIYGDSESNSICFNDNQNNLSDRVRTNEEQAWSISEQWNSNQTYTSPNISHILQEVIEGTGYSPNDPITLLLEEAYNNQGKRSAYSFDGSSAKAPTLCIEYYEDVYTLSGRIYTYCNGAEDEPVAGVTVEFSGNHLGNNPQVYGITDDNGYYEFKFQANRNAKVEPCKTEVSSCGINGNDVSIINNHVLNAGNTGLDSPYKILGADIDNNESIEYTDANHLTDFLNGPPGIPDFYAVGGQHWKFVFAAFNFPFPSNPWATVFPVFEVYNGLPYADVPNQDFIAIKVGDVDCSYESICELQSATSTCISLNADCQDAEEYNGGSVALTSNLDLGKWLIGLNFTGANIPSNAIIESAHIKFVATGDEDQNTAPCDLNIWGSPDNISCFTDDDDNISSRSRTTASETWHITGAWIQDQVYISPDLSAIVQAIIDAPGYGIASSINLMLAGEEENAGIREAYSFDKNPRLAPVLCVSYSIAPVCNPFLATNTNGRGENVGRTSVSMTQNNVPTKNTISIVKAFPNPFTDQLSIDFELNKEATVTLKIYNILGQTVYKKTEEYGRGHHQLNVKDLSLPKSSLLNYVLESSNEQVSGKLMYIKD